MKLPRASGILLHPTSLDGPHGSGDCGAAAYRFVDWLVDAGQSLWQILPLCGAGAGNSPYASSSAFAGNVLLIDLAALRRHGWLDDADLDAPQPFDPHRIDHERVRAFRMTRLERAARRFEALAGDAPQRLAFDGFCRAHAAWLDDYSLFMSLDEAHGRCSWTAWPQPLAAHQPQAVRDAMTRHAGRVAFWKFCQWCFFSQWQQLKSHANRRGVRIVGDLPIFISHQSAEVWARQDLFELRADGQPEVVAGVPPDFFSATGQRWGNPLYRWSAHAADGFAWWLQRLRLAFECVDIVRLDHFRGFAAHWEIPADEPTAVHGRWVDGPGAALFTAVESALGPTPIIAEDLGSITPDVLALRRRFGFPGMRVLQFAFGDDARNPYLPHNHDADSVVYPGTHDNDTCVGWWSGLGEPERHRVREYLNTDGADIAWTLIRAAQASVADTAIVAIQDVLGLDGRARMNTPGQASGCWEWRMSREQLQPWHAQRLAELGRIFGRSGWGRP